MAKRNARTRSTKSPSTTRQASGAARSKSLVGKLEEASTSVTDFTGKIPSGAIFWGLGALALGAAAYGAYLYRDRIIEMYEDTMESFSSDESDSDGASSTATDSSRKSKSNSSLSQVEQH